MAESYSITVKKSFLTDLKPLICCSESQGVCKDDKFCASDPTAWPVIKNGEEMVRLSAPEEEGSLSGTKEFCENYKDWYDRSSCSSTNGNCAIDDQDLKQVANYCEQIKTDTSGGSIWSKLFQGAGGLGAVAGTIYVIRKIIKLIKKSGEKLAETGAAIKGVGDGIESVSNSTKHLFSVSIPTFIKTAKYVFSFEWLKKKTPEATAPEPAPEKTPAPVLPQPSTPETKVEEIDSSTKISVQSPHFNVIRAQLAELAEAEDSRVVGDRFLHLSDDAKMYLAILAVKHWDGETEGKRNFYLKNDHSIADGKLPQDYLLRFARYQLKSEASLEVVEASARLCLERHRTEQSADRPLPAIADFSPRLIDIRRQLVHDSRFHAASAFVQNYIAKQAIVTWYALPQNIRNSFISSADTPETGTLPQKYIRFFRKRSLTNISTYIEKALILEHFLEKMPALKELQFHAIDLRLSRVVLGWEILPQTVKGEFYKLVTKEELALRKQIPFAFSKYVLEVTALSLAPRAHLEASSGEWLQQNSPILIHRGVNLQETMKVIDKLSSDMKLYPRVLMARAATTYDAWLLLHSAARAEFKLLDSQRLRISPPNSLPMPENFIEFIFKLNSGIGITPREKIDGELNKNGSNDPSSGSNLVANFDPMKTQEMVRPNFAAAANNYAPVMTPAQSALFTETPPRAAVNIQQSPAPIVFNTPAPIVEVDPAQDPNSNNFIQLANMYLEGSAAEDTNIEMQNVAAQNFAMIGIPKVVGL